MCQTPTPFDAAASAKRSFEAGVASEYSIGFANGSDPRRATSFEANQYGLYAGDQGGVQHRITGGHAEGDVLMAGVRVGGRTLRETALEAIEATAFYPPAGKNRIRSIVGDRVHVEMTPYDLTKGRITFRFK